MTDFYSIISQAVLDGDDKVVAQTVNQALKDDISAEDILKQGLVPGIQALGARFKDGEVFLPEILISVRAMNSGVDLLKPHYTGQEARKLGTIVLGTIEGDLHDIGKNLVHLLLECNGFQVIDLGIDVPVATFVRATHENKADIVAVSALLTTTMVSISGVVDALKKSGLQGKTRVMIGGAPITRDFADSIGAEGFAEDCISAVDEAKRLMEVK